MKTLQTRMIPIPAPGTLRALLALLGGAAMLLTAACDEGNEGDRCNPLESHNDCNGSLVCTQPQFCAENYCCPANVTPSDNAYCQPGCAGGAASICAAVMDASAPACAFATCTADASPATCATLVSGD
jgi:hypothetical protein